MLERGLEILFGLGLFAHQKRAVGKARAGIKKLTATTRLTLYYVTRGAVGALKSGTVKNLGDAFAFGIVHATQEKSKTSAFDFHRLAADRTELALGLFFKRFYLCLLFGHRHSNFAFRIGTGHKLAHATKLDEHHFAAVRTGRRRLLY